MERWEDLRRHGRDAHTTVVASTGSYHRSFSSSLLDAIYRSIDEGTGTGAAGGRQREWSVVDAAGKPPAHRTTVEERQRTTTSAQKPAHSRRGGADAMNDQPQRHHRGGSCRKQQQQQHQQRQLVFANSTSSSSDSSYGGFSSSSDAEKAAPPVVDLSATTPRPRPIRTTRPPPEEKKKKKKLPKEAEGSIGDRFRASKLYRELKKAKTPASPGARLASFLNTLFATAGSTTKKAAAAKEAATGSADASLCSSASSYSRSRLSRTPSKAAPAAACPDATRRPVRFFPLSFAVDDDCRPRGHRVAYAAADQKLTRRGYPPAATQVAEVRRPTREATREFIRDYEEQSRGSDGLPQGDERDECEAAEVDEDDDTASYSSSDLFELENLKAIGGGAGGELPVYETTRLEAGRGLAQGPGVQRKIEIR